MTLLVGCGTAMATDGTIDQGQSALQAAVFGANGQALAGGFEVVKTREDGAYTDGRYLKVIERSAGGKFEVFVSEV